MDNKTTSKILPVKGINTPKLILWIMGYIDGKIMKTGGLDEKQVITSGYVSGQTKRYNSAVLTRIKELEQSLAPVWSKADTLLVEWDSISAEYDSSLLDNDPKSGPQARKLKKLKLAKKNILMELAHVESQILCNGNSAQKEIQATKEALIAGFSSYGSGLLCHPLRDSNLPIIKTETALDQILSQHSKSWDSIQLLIDEAREVKEVS